jgi:hypothetical protein
MREIRRRATVISLTPTENLGDQEFKDDEFKRNVKIYFGIQSMDLCQYWLGNLVPTYDKVLKWGGAMFKNWFLYAQQYLNKSIRVEMKESIIWLSKLILWPIFLLTPALDRDVIPLMKIVSL